MSSTSWLRRAIRRSAIVDFPPVTAWIGWVSVQLFGPSLAALRMTSQISTLIGVTLVALMVRELGGGRITQAVGASAWAVTPFALGGGASSTRRSSTRLCGSRSAIWRS